MKILVAVPSRNRYRTTEIVRNTFSWLKYSKYDFKIFVEPNEYELYCEAVGKKNVVSNGKNNCGLGGQKCFIQKYALKNDYDLIFKCDDDIWNWRDFKNGWYPYYHKTNGVPMEERKRAMAVYVFDKVVNDCIELFEKRNEVGAVSFFQDQMMFHKPGTKWVKFNSVPHGCYIVRTELFAPKMQDKVHQFEEFYTWYNMLKLGYVCPLYGLSGFHIDGNYGDNSGGFQDFDRKKMTIESLKILTKIFPNELRWKKDNGKGGFIFDPNIRKMPLCKDVPVPEELKN